MCNYFQDNKENIYESTWNKRKRISTFTGDYNTQKMNINENSEVKVRGEKA